MTDTAHICDDCLANAQRDATIDLLFAKTAREPNAAAIEAATARCADLFDLCPARVAENFDAAYARVTPTAKGGAEILEEVLSQLLDASAA
jgi:hypothetical protein